MEVLKNGKTATKENIVITIPQIEIKHLNLVVVGDSELVVHRWSEKAKKQMLDKQMKKAKQAKTAKDPWMDFCESMYWLDPEMPTKPTQKDIDKAKFGFPSIGFKASAVTACTSIDGMTKVAARQSFHIDEEFVTIDGVPRMREDMVKIAMGTSDIRYRGGFTKWSCNLEIKYNSRAISAEQIINMMNVAGFGVGVGEWRPEKNGQFGRFHVK